MKVAPKVILLFRDAVGFGAAISDALQPGPNVPLQRTETSFELSLEKYGIKDCKASGDIVHFINEEGFYQVSIMLLQTYEPPVVVCAVNEILASIARENSSTKPTFVVPFLVAESKLKWETKNLTMSSNGVELYGVEIGPSSDLTLSIVAGTQKPLPSLQIQCEPMACLIHLVRVLGLSTVLLIGPKDQHQSHRSSNSELEVLYKMGEFLASTTSLCLSKDKICWNQTEKSRVEQEPWRTLYG